MTRLDIFRMGYILFILLVVVVFASGNDKSLYATYLIFGALSLFSVLLHTVINKLDALNTKLEALADHSK